MKFLFLLMFSFSVMAQKEKLGANLKEQVVSDQITIDSQKTINKIDDENNSLFLEYRNTLRQIENTKAYNNQVAQLIESQKSEKLSLLKQIDGLKTANQEIVPLMDHMVTTLSDLVKGDTPFLKEERLKRVDDLKEMMKRADVSTSEKYRRIMEAYQIENDYGRTLEAYRGNITLDENSLTVDFLRVGRLLLLYQTLDSKIQGVWDQKTKKWLPLEDDYRRSIVEGLKMARKQTTPNLMTLPLFKPENL
jgi:hypothetical protein